MRRFSLLFGLAGFALVAAFPVFAAPGGGGGRAQGPRAVTGQVTAKGETTIDVQGRGRGGAAGETVKVTVEQATKFYKLEPGTKEDLAADYLVVVVGAQAENKVTADGIVRLGKVAGTPSADELRVATGIGGVAARLLQARRPAQGEGQPPAGGQAQARPVVGKIVSTQPLTIETRRGDKVEVQTVDATRVLRQAEAAFADLQQGTNVIVIPKAQPENGAATAVAVVQLPPMGGRRGGNR